MNSYIKIIKTLVIISTMAPLISWAESFEFHNSTYKEAKKAESFARFDMSSTKLGLVTTSFTGFVKNFTLNGSVKGNVLSEAQIEFAVKELDTDIDGRNEKMWDHCLNAKEHPTVHITLLEDIELNGSSQPRSAKINVRGVDKPATLNVKAERLENGDLVFDIDGELSLKELELPNPSIMVASVKDKIKLKSRLVIKAK